MLRAVRLAAKLGLAIDPKTAAPIPKLAPLIAERAAGAPVRRDAEAAAFRPRRRDAAQPARARAVARPAAAARRDPRAAARASASSRSRSPSTDARVREDKGVSPAFLFATLLWHEVLATWNAAKARGERAAARAVRRDGHGARRAGGAHRDPAPLRGDDQGDLVAAAALRAARRAASVPAARASALSRRLRLPRAARRERARRRRRSSTGGRASRTQRPTEREAMLQPGRGAEEAAPLARTRPQAARRRRRARDSRRRRAAGRRRSARVTRDARLRRPRQQPRAPAPAARARAARARAAAAHARASRVSPNYVTAPHRASDAAARLRQRGRAASTRRSRRARCSRGCMRSSAASIAAATRERRATRRGRSISICYYSARRRMRVPRSDGAASAHARARVRAASARRHRAGGRRFPGRGSRAGTARACAASASRARAHASPADRASRPTPQWISTQCRYIVVEGPIGAGKTSLARELAHHLHADDAARAARGQPVPRALLRRHGALRAADAAHVPVPARRPAARRSRSSTCSARPTVADFLLDKDPLFARLNLSDDEYALYDKVYCAPEAADADARSRHLPAGAGGHAGRARASARRRLRAADPGEYLARLADAYTRFFYQYDEAPLLIVNSERLNFVDNPAHVELLLERIAGMRGRREFFNLGPA